MVSTPPTSILTKLYAGIPSFSYDSDNFDYYSEIIGQFQDDYYSQLVPSLSKSNDFVGTVDSVIEGRQVLLELVYEMILKKVRMIDLTKEFPSVTLDETSAEEVTRDYAMLVFLEYLYKPISKTGDIERDYIKEIRNALTSGGGEIHIGSTQTFGEGGGTVNPIFDATGGKDGMEISIDISKFTPEVLKKVLWTLHFDGSVFTSFNSIKTIENIENKIKDPIIHLYTTLYNALKAYVDEGYYTSSLSEFTVNFYRPWLGGMNKNTRLSLQFTGELKKNSIESIDFGLGNEMEFRKKVAAVVFYMVKYMSTINIKQGAFNSPTNVLSANIFTILSQEYMLQNFNPKALKIGGKLQPFWLGSDEYTDLVATYQDGAFTFSNAFPIWLFKGADNFHEWFAELFNKEAAKHSGAADIFPIFPNQRSIDDLLELD